MAITIDQFLRELTERRLLSGEEASAFRQELAPQTNDPPPAARNEAAKNGTAAHAATQTVSVPDASPLVLCNCLLKERIQNHDNHLIFQAEHLQDNSTVSLHVLMPRGAAAKAAGSIPLNGKSGEAAADPSTAVGILDVGRHGEMVCICCQAIEAESLHEVVQQYEKLPLELATESLLETVKTLARLHSQGLQLDTISAKQLLLDEEGRIHLTGQNPAAILGNASSAPDDPLPPASRLLDALGGLYLFLQTGQSELAPPAEEAHSQSAGLIYQRLTGANAMPRYESWGGLIRDLETLGKGEELIPPAPRSVESRPTPSREPQPIASTPANTPPASSSTWGLLIGLALLGGIVIAAVALLLR